MSGPPGTINPGSRTDEHLDSGPPGAAPTQGATVPVTPSDVEHVLRQRDPESLIAIGAPADEYECEAADLFTILVERDLTLDDLTRVWTEWFSDAAWFLHDSAAADRAALVDALNTLREH